MLFDHHNSVPTDRADYMRGRSRQQISTTLMRLLNRARTTRTEAGILRAMAQAVRFQLRDPAG